MKKDGLADKTSRALHRHYDHVLNEPIPQELRALLEKLK